MLMTITMMITRHSWQMNELGIVLLCSLWLYHRLVLKRSAVDFNDEIC